MVLYPNKLPESERVCSGICKYGVEFVGCLWGNGELKQIPAICTISHPKEIFDIVL